MEVSNSNLIIGCTVLSSTQATQLPLFSQGALNVHVEGCVHGRVGIRAHCAAGPIYIPQKGRSFYLSSTQDLGEEKTTGIVQAFDNLNLGIQDGSGPEDEKGVANRMLSACLSNNVSAGIVGLEQRSPYGFTVITSLDCELYLYGLHSNRVSVLYWTNMEQESFENLVRQECGNTYWFYRFLPRKNQTLVLHTKRICSRWYRWGENPSMRDPSRRFQALETSLSNGALKHDD